MPLYRTLGNPTAHWQVGACSLGLLKLAAAGASVMRQAWRISPANFRDFGCRTFPIALLQSVRYPYRTPERKPMRSYLTAAGLASSLVAVWIALVQVIA